MHHRTWLLSPQDLEIIDEVSGRHEHQLEWHFHFHPGIGLRKISNLAVELVSDKPSFPKMIMSWDLESQVAIENYEWSLEFGKRIPAQKLILRGTYALPCRNITRLVWETP